MSTLRSMTGFGRGTAQSGATTATVEVRTVNGRFAEVNVRAPRVLNPHEADVTALVKDAIARGNATVSISLDRDAPESGLAVNVRAAERVGQALREAAQAAGLGAETVTLADVLRFPEVLRPAPADAEVEEAEAWDAARAALAEALGHLDAMRLAEGDALHSALTDHADDLERHTAEVEARAPQRVDEHRQRLALKLDDLLGDDRLDRARLETEIALLADKLDVTEETVRLRSHVAQFREALGANEPVGRRLNFISQEMNREANTIASKANDPALAEHAVGMKEALEKIREQIANVV